MVGTDIDALCKAREWSRARLIHELRQAGRSTGSQLPNDESLRRMVREWASGRRGISEFYAVLLSTVFGVEFAPGRGDHGDEDTAVDELTTRLQSASKADLVMVGLFEDQTQMFRVLDRQLGAAHLLKQTEQHVEQVSSLLAYSMPGPVRSGLAAALAEAAALAGWQALDLGDPRRSWQLHEAAKAAALESGSSSILAHVTAQQAYALLDLDRAADAVQLIRHARGTAGTAIPDLLRSWLWAAEAESLAAAGRENDVREATDEATRLLPDDPRHPDLPFIFLSSFHLGRWRGHCLAQLGASEAVDELVTSLSAMDKTFTRAEAALRTDLALAYSVRGEHEAARACARAALGLANQTASARQQRRLNRLLTSGTHPDR